MKWNPLSSRRYNLTVFICVWLLMFVAWCLFWIVGCQRQANDKWLSTYAEYGQQVYSSDIAAVTVAEPKQQFFSEIYLTIFILMTVCAPNGRNVFIFAMPQYDDFGQSHFIRSHAIQMSISNGFSGRRPTNLIAIPMRLLPWDTKLNKDTANEKRVRDWNL